MHTTRYLVAIAAAALTLLLAAPAAGDIQPGFDLFETDPAQTAFEFSPPFAIPPDFFAPGSQPFTGIVKFGGNPIGRFQGKDIGDADTIVRRLQSAPLMAPFPAQAFVPIEMVALNLQSVQPITVMVNNQPEQWDVNVGLSAAQPSRGQMRIVQANEQGGAFDSQLQVFPMFTFTRLSDRATRVLDVGQIVTPSSREAHELELQASNTPWRPGCVPPALLVRGLNDGFCPGLTPDGQKQLTVEQARLAHHGVVPAQPRLEHFKCYSTTRVPRNRAVTLRDQFGSTRANVLNLVQLCNPVQKNRELFVNGTAHLTCYSISEPAVRRPDIAVRNQFGADTLRIVAARRLCLPTLKTRLTVIRRPAVPAHVLTDHFKCYQVTSPNRFTIRSVRLKDQFRSGLNRVLKPVLLCAPVQKNRFRVQHPVRHLVCYQLNDPVEFQRRKVRVFNQFGARNIYALKPQSLCVPSLKVPIPQSLRVRG